MSAEGTKKDEISELHQARLYGHAELAGVGLEQQCSIARRRILSDGLLFNIRPLKGIEEVRNEVRKLVAKQKKGSIDDLTAFAGEIEELLALLEFKPEWKKLPVVARAARVDIAGKAMPYSENVVLPNTKHDLELVIKMLNYMREQKQLAAVKMSLFVQPDEISLAHREGRISYEGGSIMSQIAVVLQKGAVMYAGFVFGRKYVILQN